MQLNKKIPQMALPLILSNITVPLLGLSNTIISGHLPHGNYLAAIGIGTMIFNFLYWGLGFFRMSSTGLIAQAYGTDNIDEINSTLLHSLGLALIIGLLLIALQLPIYRLAALLVHPDKNILLFVKHYYLIRIWGAPAVLMNFVLVGTLVAIQKPKGPLILLTVTNLLAISLSVIFVFGFNLSIKGIALADILAQYTGLITGLIILNKYNNLKILQKNVRFQAEKLIKLLHANRDIFIRTLCLITVFSFFTIWSSHISALTLAANTLLMNFSQIMASALGGFDNVAEALSGEAVGKKQRKLFKKSIVDVACWVALFSLTITLLYSIFGKYLINLMTNLTLVRHTAYQFLPYAAALPIIAAPSFLFDGVAIGANIFKAMRNSMIATVILFFFVWFSLNKYANTGLWLAFSCFFLFRAIFLGGYIIKFYNQRDFFKEHN